MLAHSAGLVAAPSSGVTVLKRIPVAGGTLTRFSHASFETKTPMVVSVFIPPGLEYAAEVPALYWLSGLTCTDENFCQKAGAFAHAARHKLALVVPDTSPRGVGIEGEDDSYDLGTGAGFYVDAMAAPWADNYRMFSYITKDCACRERVQDLEHPAVDLRSFYGRARRNVARAIRVVPRRTPVVSPSERCTLASHSR
jgi:S-formylglutathione hydrolase